MRFPIMMEMSWQDISPGIDGDDGGFILADEKNWFIVCSTLESGKKHCSPFSQTVAVFGRNGSAGLEFTIVLKIVDEIGFSSS